MEQLPVNYAVQLQCGIWGKQVPRNKTKISINLYQSKISQHWCICNEFILVRHIYGKWKPPVVSTVLSTTTIPDTYTRPYAVFYHIFSTGGLFTRTCYTYVGWLTLQFQVWILADPIWTEYCCTTQCLLGIKRQKLQPGFSCDKNRKVLKVCKQWQPLCGCCNVVSFIRNGISSLKEGQWTKDTKGYLWQSLGKM